MNSRLLAEVPTSTAVSDTSLLKETSLVGLHLGANISETSASRLHFTNLLIFKQRIRILYMNISQILDSSFQ